MTSYRDFEYAQKAIDLGVSSYLLKLSASSKDIMLAIDKALQSGVDSETNIVSEKFVIHQF